MGFFDKIKNLFIDEPDEPIKKEFIPVEIASPKPEEPRENIAISDANVIQRIEKIQAPVFFSDKDFEDLGKSSRYQRKRVDFPPAKKEEIKEEPRVFKPSPIISPVYGVLDKNYRRDDIDNKKQVKKNDVPESISKEMSIDDIRKKAYGTLEEELENELIGGASMLFKDELIIQEEPDLFEELKNKEEIIIHNMDEIETNNSISNVNINDSNENDITSIVDDEITNMFFEEEQLTEGDLFDLVNSMYEKGDKVDD